jgi:RNA polymerase sigma-70 factor, ECF subfamily
MFSVYALDRERLLTEARQGDREALGALLETYRKYLHGLAGRQMYLRLQTRADPADVVQETYLHVCRRFEQFRGDSEKELLGWVRRILVRTLSRLVDKQVRAQKRSVYREVSLQAGSAAGEDEGAEPVVLTSPATSPSAEAQRRELAAAITAQLDQLLPAHREVIVLRNLEGLAFEDVARRMGRSSGAVRVLWLRALEQLRRIHTEQTSFSLDDSNNHRLQTKEGVHPT